MSLDSRIVDTGLKEDQCHWTPGIVDTGLKEDQCHRTPGIVDTGLKEDLSTIPGIQWHWSSLRHVSTIPGVPVTLTFLEACVHYPGVLWHWPSLRPVSTIPGVLWHWPSLRPVSTVSAIQLCCSSVRPVPNIPGILWQCDIDLSWGLCQTRLLSLESCHIAVPRGVCPLFLESLILLEACVHCSWNH